MTWRQALLILLLVCWTTPHLAHSEVYSKDYAVRCQRRDYAAGGYDGYYEAVTAAATAAGCITGSSAGNSVTSTAGSTHVLPELKKAVAALRTAAASIDNVEDSSNSDETLATPAGLTSSHGGSTLATVGVAAVGPAAGQVQPSLGKWRAQPAWQDAADLTGSTTATQAKNARRGSAMLQDLAEDESYYTYRRLTPSSAGVKAGSTALSFLTSSDQDDVKDEDQEQEWLRIEAEEDEGGDGDGDDYEEQDNVIEWLKRNNIRSKTKRTARHTASHSSKHAGGHSASRRSSVGKTTSVVGGRKKSSLGRRGMTDVSSMNEVVDILNAEKWKLLNLQKEAHVTWLTQQVKERTKKQDKPVYVFTNLS